MNDGFGGIYSEPVRVPTRGFGRGSAYGFPRGPDGVAVPPSGEPGIPGYGGYVDRPRVQMAGPVMPGEQDGDPLVSMVHQQGLALTTLIDQHRLANDRKIMNHLRPIQKPSSIDAQSIEKLIKQ